MFTSSKSFRLVAALLAAFLMVTGLQASASAATTRSLSLAASPAAGVVGTKVVLSGKLTKSPKGTKVTIERKSGKKWVKAGATRTTSSAGSYSVRITRPKTVGTYSYRAVSAKKGSLKAAKSKTITVAAGKRTLISLSSSTALTIAGTGVGLSGTVLPSVKGTTVTLQRKSGTTWVNVATTSVTANGTFSKAVVPLSSTTYRAVVSRTSKNAPATSNERIVKARPVIGTGKLPTGTHLGFYSTKLIAAYQAVGTWSSIGLAGTGLSLNATTGVLSGFPSAAGSKNVTFGFTQSGTGLTAPTKTLTIQVGPAKDPVISTSALNPGTVGVAYSQTLVAAGNPVGTWTAAPLPNGLVLDENTGVISGTPATAGTTSVAIKFTQTNSARSSSKTLPLTISNPAAPEIATTALPAGERGTPYSFGLTTVGNATGTWTASPLPDGLTLNAGTGVISGTPSVIAVSQQVVIGFTQTSTGVSAPTKTLHLQIGAGNNPVITTANLPDGRRLAPYGPVTLTAAGDPAGTWTASPLPDGLTLNAGTGVISGTPTLGANTAQVVIGFTQTSTGLAAAPKTLTLTILPAAPPVITTVSLPNGTRFQPYGPVTLTAAGNPVGTWTASPLPAGLTLNASTGVISGTPTAAGDTDVVVGFTQTNTGVAAVPKTLTLHVDQAPAPVIDTANLPEGTRFNFYTTTLVAGGAVGTWTATNLPTGLSLNAATGVISGTPTVVETKSVEIGFTQTNTGLAAEPKTLVLKINQASPPVIATTALPTAIRYQTYSAQVTVTGNPPGTWSSSTLPAGITFNTTTGVLAGKPRNAGTTNITFSFTQTISGLVSANKVLALQVDQSVPVILTAARLPDATTISGYDIQLQVEPAPVGKWTLVGGSPPLGLTLKSTGQLSGSTVLPGNYSFTIRFTETSTNLSSQRTFLLKVS